MLGTIITKERILSSSSFPFNIENNPKMQVHRTDEKIEKVGSEAVHEQHFQNILCVKNTGYCPTAKFHSATNRLCACCTAVCSLSSAHWETTELACMRLWESNLLFPHKMQFLQTFNLSDICLEIYLVSTVQHLRTWPGGDIFVSKCASSGSGDSASRRILAQLSETRQTC